MKESKRPALTAGLVLTTLEVFMFIITQLIFRYQDTLVKVIFAVCVVIFFVNVKSFYTVNLSAKEFKKQRVYPWVSFVLVLLYNCYLLAVILINKEDGIHSPDTMMIANFIIITLALVLYLLGLLKRVIDNKITYEEHINQTKNEK